MEAAACRSAQRDSPPRLSDRFHFLLEGCRALGRAGFSDDRRITSRRRLHRLLIASFSKHRAEIPIVYSLLCETKSAVLLYLACSPNKRRQCDSRECAA